jgi:hypothetical protein
MDVQRAPTRGGADDPLTRTLNLNHDPLYDMTSYLQDGVFC